MIDEKFILSEVEKSKKNQRTTVFIRNFVFKIVEEATISIYGKNYSNRCAQTSSGIEFLLSDLGIKSHIYAGPVCILYALLSKDRDIHVRWNGFWDDQTHLFNITEFNELVDLSISQVHSINSVNKDNHPFLPFWWKLSERLPPIFLYVKDARGTYGIPEDDKENYTLFMQKVIDIKKNFIKTLNPEDISYRDILSNRISLEILASDYESLKTALYVMQNCIPDYPIYFQEKLKYSQGNIL